MVFNRRTVDVKRVCMSSTSTSTTKNPTNSFQSGIVYSSKLKSTFNKEILIWKNLYIKIAWCLFLFLCKYLAVFLYLSNFITNVEMFTLVFSFKYFKKHTQLTFYHIHQALNYNNLLKLFGESFVKKYIMINSVEKNIKLFCIFCCYGQINN